MMEKIKNFFGKIATGLKKASAVMKVIFGYGMLTALAVTVCMFIGFLVAFVIGGDTAALISEFIYKKVTPILIYATSILVLFGLLAMYFGGEAALSSSKKPKNNEKNENVPESGEEKHN